MKNLLLGSIISLVLAVAAKAQDVSETVLTNTKVTLTVTADGTLPITYTWFKNNVQVATGTSLVINSVQASDAGTYKATATNLAGSTDSNNATIVVITPVAPSNVKITITKG